MMWWKVFVDGGPRWCYNLISFGPPVLAIQSVGPVTSSASNWYYKCLEVHLTGWALPPLLLGILVGEGLPDPEDSLLFFIESLVESSIYVFWKLFSCSSFSNYWMCDAYLFLNQSFYLPTALHFLIVRKRKRKNTMCTLPYKGNQKQNIYDTHIKNK